MKQRLYILCGLFGLQFASIGLSWVLPQSMLVKVCMVAATAGLIVVQIRWLHRDMEEEEARISRRVWRGWTDDAKP
jgi:hypothetical protein